MILLKTKEEIELIRDSARLLGKTLAEVGRHIQPGVTTAYLDKIGEQFIRDNGGIPLCKGYEGFPSAFCISVNDVVVHGIPSDNFFIKEGDNVSLDCVIELNGYVSDSAYTFTCGEASPEMQRLLKVTKEALYIGLEKCKAGNRVGDIGHAVQQHCENIPWFVNSADTGWVSKCTRAPMSPTMVSPAPVRSSRKGWSSLSSLWSAWVLRMLSSHAKTVGPAEPGTANLLPILNTP